MCAKRAFISVMPKRERALQGSQADCGTRSGCLVLLPSGPDTVHSAFVAQDPAALQSPFTLRRYTHYNGRRLKRQLPFFRLIKRCPADLRGMEQTRSGY